jgi:hypothetical protein
MQCVTEQTATEVHTEWLGYVSAVLQFSNRWTYYMQQANQNKTKQKKYKNKFTSCTKISRVRWLLAQISSTSATDAGTPVTDLLSLRCTVRHLIGPSVTDLLSLQCTVRHLIGLPITDLLSLQCTIRHLMQCRRKL